MAKKALLTVDGVHRKVKKGFITQASVHHKVKKAFITVGGVYRPCWAGGELTYYGTVTVSEMDFYDSACAASNGKYAVLRGDYGYSMDDYDVDDVWDYEYANNIVAVDKSLTGKYVENAWDNISYGWAVTTGDKAVFGGGFGTTHDAGYGDYSWFPDGVDAYDTSLTKTYSSSIQNACGCDKATVSFGNYAALAGGWYDDWWLNEDSEDSISYEYDTYYQSACSFFDSSLTSCKTHNFSGSRAFLAGCATSQRAMFMGGENQDSGSSYSNGLAVDTSLAELTPPNLSSQRCYHGAASVGNYMLFAGGRTSWSGTILDSVDVYDNSLTRTSATKLPSARYDMTSLSLGDYALFIGSGKTAVAYDSSLTQTTYSLAQYPSYKAGAVIGNFALAMCGGSKLEAFTLV